MSEFWNEGIAIGDTVTGCLVQDLSRLHIAQYAGASGDFNSVHVDERFAVEDAGRLSVIGHGMFTMGLTATFLTSLVGRGPLLSFGGRFLAPVFPGDTLSCTVTVEDVILGDRGRNVVIRLETSNSEGIAVFDGTAIVEGPAH
jgi:acyl dehydratase